MAEQQPFTPYQMLDLIMAELWTPLTYDALRATITGKHKQITKELLEQGIEKLRQDGYVYVVDNNKYVNDTELKDGWYIRRTYNGQMLVLNNGYVRLTETEERRRKNRNLKDVLIIVGTLVAGLGAIAIVAWEIYKTFCLGK
jgi:hypothetical protein